MKFSIPEISWHNRDPVLSIDFQPKKSHNDYLRLATGGTDSHVLIWYISTTDIGSVNLEVAADLTRHHKAVNVVRWSPNGKYLASGDDEAIIFVWKQKTDEKETTVQTVELGEELYKESWIVYKTLRGHMEDVLDISWSPNSEHLASGSVDNKLLLWDLSKGRYTCILSDHKGFVQGVAWDPKEQFIATASSDRMFRTFDITTKKVLSRSNKATLPFPADHPLHKVPVRLYHDDTLQTYFRRLDISPDGMLIAVPAGRIESEQGKLDGKPMNAIYIYTRHSLKVLTDITWSPDIRMLVASSTDGYCSVITFAEGELGELMPDEEKNFNELEPMELQTAEEGQKEKSPETPKSVNTSKIDSFIKFKSPVDKSPKKPNISTKGDKTPVKLDILVDTAMPSWSDNSSSEIIKPKNAETPEIMIIEDSEDIKLVYEETQQVSLSSKPEERSKPESPQKVEIKHKQSSTEKGKTDFFKKAKVTDIKNNVTGTTAPTTKAPRRVNFITLSSPKNSKKK